MSPQICQRLNQHVCARVVAATYRHWRIDTHDIALLDQQLARLVAQLAHLVLGYGSACAQLCDGPVEVTTTDAHSCPQSPNEGCACVAASCLCAVAARCTGGVALGTDGSRRWSERRYYGGEDPVSGSAEYQTTKANSKHCGERRSCGRATLAM
jgi:hypothetical protein